MHFKEKMMHFIEESSQKLRLTYQSTLHSIQVVNVLDNHHANSINKLVNRSLLKAKCFALSLLGLCCKLYETHAIHMREYVRLIDPKYKDIAIEHLEKTSMHSEEKLENSLTSQEIEQLIKEYELRWKLSIPLLYDQVIMIAYAWDKYTNELTQFPLKFQSHPSGREENAYSENHNYLVKNIRICLYNFNHLIRNTNMETISNKIRKLSFALFFASIKHMLKDHARIQSYILSPKLSIAYLLSDFFKKHFSILAEDISSQIVLISEVLQNYRRFRQKSKQKKETVKKFTHKSNKHSEDKENIMYYVNRQKNRSKGKKLIENTDERSQKFKSRSRSKKDKETKTKDKPKLIKSKDSIVLKANKKKSNSTKSIITRNVNLLVKEKQKLVESNQLKKQRKVIKFSKSRVSKRSEKSQLNSKIIPNGNLESDFCSKSTYWLKSTTLAKTDKKSTNSSIRMKMR